MEQSGTAQREAALIAHLEAAGYRRAAPAVLQPAATFLDLSGEDIRTRIFLTSSLDGQEFCLRPELTIPLCLDYLAGNGNGTPAAFSCLGPVFRQRAQGPVEFHQAGIESFGRTDREAADAEVLALSLEAASAGGAPALTISMGDAGLFSDVLGKLQIDPVWLRRIRRGILRHQPFDAIFAAPENGGGRDHSGVLAALEGVDRQDARVFVEDLLSIAGISPVSGRTPAEIAERFLDQSAQRAPREFPGEKRKVIESWLGISGDPDSCSAAMRKLADDSQLDLQKALDQFDARIGFMAARGIDVGEISFSGSFARNLDYYTGFVFEASEPSHAGGRPVVAGGRYDGLLRALGAKDDIPAVGAAIWCDRLVREGNADS